MVLQTCTIMLMGTEITVTEEYEGQFEQDRLLRDERKRAEEEKIAIYRAHPAGAFHFQVINAIHLKRGTDFLFLMKKQLFASDVCKGQNRIYVTKTEKFMEYLRKDEVKEIEGEGLNVIAVDPRGESYSLDLKTWTERKKYVLIKEWRKLVEDNGLRKDDEVEIWCFRAELKLCVVVIAKKVARVVEADNVDRGLG